MMVPDYIRFVGLFVLGFCSIAWADPIKEASAGLGSFGKKYSSSNFQIYDPDFATQYAPRRPDFDEGHKEDIEQESIKYHSLVNKALNSAKDALRFVGDSIKDQEQSGHRYKREAIRSRKNFRRTEAQAGSSKRAAPPLSDEGEIDPIADRVAAKDAGADYEEAAAEATTGEKDAAGGAEEPAAKEAGAGEEGDDDINPEKIDEMIDLMNSLNQKFAKMIANWDEYAASKGGSPDDASATEDEDTIAPMKKRKAKSKLAKKKAAKVAETDEAGEEAAEPEYDAAAEPAEEAVKSRKKLF